MIFYLSQVPNLPSVPVSELPPRHLIPSPAIVKGVIDDIRSEGDAAIRRYSEKFDKWSPKSFRLSQSEIDDIISTVPKQTLEDIKTVQANVRAFAKRQRASMTDFEMEIRPGVHLGQRTTPIENVGW